MKRKQINKTYPIILFLLFIIIAFLILLRHYKIDKMNSYYKEIEKRNMIEIENYKIHVYKNLELGNIVAYPNSKNFNRRLFDEFVYEKYGVYLCHAFISKGDKEEVAKSIMDSVIFKKYGVDFYNKLIPEYDNLERTIPQNMTIDGYYINVRYNYHDLEKTRKYVLNELKAKKLIPLNQNPFYPRELRVDFIVDKDGLIKKNEFF